MSYKDPGMKKLKSKEYRDKPENKARMKLYGQKYHLKYKEIHRKQNYLWQKRNRVKLNEKHKLYRMRDFEKYKENERRARFKRVYDITLEDYNEILKGQNGCCAICNRPDVTGKKLAVDHCHKTGKVRGLLCTTCNQAIGMLGESVENLANAIKYLSRKEVGIENSISSVRA